MNRTWINSKLGDIITTSSGGTPNRSNAEFYNGTIPWIKTGELKNKYIYEAEEYITEDAIKKSSAKIFPKNTVLLAMYGATIGNCSILKTESSTNQACCAFLPSEKIDHEFLYYKFNYEKNEIIALGAGGAQPNISQKILKDYIINYPPRIYEQQKIAAILSSVDEAIEKTEQIIEQTETVKKGLMQELFFKGVGHTEFKQTHLGEIPLSWDLVQTGDLFENKSVKNHEHLEVLSVTQDEGVVLRKDLDINIKYNKNSLQNYKKVDSGNFIISLRSFQGGLEVSTYEGIVSPAYTVLNNKVNIDENYFKYFFKSFWFIEQLKSSTIGIRDGKQISYQDFKLIKIPLPPLEEQMKISNTIEQIDKKINFENNRYLKLSNIKQGLMQELLTGKKRVNVDDSEEVLS